MKNLSKLLFGLIAIMFIATSCSKDENDENPEPDPIIENSATELSSFDGITRIGNNEIPSDGIIEVEDDNFTFINELGALTGSVSLITDEIDGISYYEVSIIQATGFFDGAVDFSGEMYSNYVNIIGTSNAGENISIQGELMTVEEANAAWESERTKSQIIFTNLESCDAYITINDETLGPLHTHWREGGYCNTPYQDALEFPKNADNKSSSLDCRNLTLKMLDGSYETFNICDIAYFVVDKEKSYTYTVSWENGETTSGSVGPLSGGHKKYICLTNDGPECEDEVEPEIGISDYNFTVTVNTTNHSLTFNLDKSNLEYSQYYNGLNSYNPYDIDAGTYTGIIIEGLHGKTPGTYTSGIEITMPFSYAHYRTYWPGETSDYTVKIEEFDLETGKVHLIFENVKMYLWENSELTHFYFSGHLIGTFEI